MQRAFQRRVGVSPKWVLKRYRLHEAAERIATGEADNLSALALDLGYFDVAHFTRQFTAAMGEPPGAYARRCARGRDRRHGSVTGADGTSLTQLRAVLDVGRWGHPCVLARRAQRRRAPGGCGGSARRSMAACQAAGFTPHVLHRAGDCQPTAALSGAGLGVGLVQDLAGVRPETAPLSGPSLSRFRVAISSQRAARR
jgi:hypothetical protein